MACSLSNNRREARLEALAYMLLRADFHSSLEKLVL